MKESKCTLCGKTLEKVTEHTYGEAVVVAATCTAEGKSTQTCTVCGDKKETVLPITHQSAETSDATGTYIEKVCSICRFSETAVDFKTIVFYIPIKSVLAAEHRRFEAGRSQSEQKQKKLVCQCGA